LVDVVATNRSSGIRRASTPSEKYIGSICWRLLTPGRSRVIVSAGSSF
jgi:hypothetical protein